MPGDATDRSTRAAGPPGPRVVVGVDGSPSSVDALTWAAHEARVRGAVLDIVHVDFARHEALELFAPQFLSDERTILEAAVERASALEPGIVVRGRDCDPPASEALVEASGGADLLVLGSRGLRRWQEIGIGSVSRACVLHARCPVAIVRPRTDSSAPGASASSPASARVDQPVNRRFTVGKAEHTEGPAAHEADPADVAEQQTPVEDDDEVSVRAEREQMLRRSPEAPEADVSEQAREVEDDEEWR